MWPPCLNSRHFFCWKMCRFQSKFFHLLTVFLNWQSQLTIVNEPPGETFTARHLPPTYEVRGRQCFQFSSNTGVGGVPQSLVPGPFPASGPMFFLRVSNSPVPLGQDKGGGYLPPWDIIGDARTEQYGGVMLRRGRYASCNNAGERSCLFCFRNKMIR